VYREAGQYSCTLLFSPLPIRTCTQCWHTEYTHDASGEMLMRQLVVFMRLAGWLAGHLARLSYCSPNISSTCCAP
jgi:hypothetical protein